jgi:UDP-galactopyranose mutase
MMNLPFDLNRVRSMIDETNLSSNARQFMNDLQHIQEQRRIKDNSSQQFNLGQLMLMMKGKISLIFDISLKKILF